MAKKKKAANPHNRSSVRNPSYNQQKKLITEIFQENIAVLRRVTDNAVFEELDLSGKNLNRRIHAVLHYMDKVVDRYKKKYPGISSIEEAFAAFESQSTFSYNGMNRYGNIYLGAALWILDELKKTFRTSELHKYLPNSLDLIMDTDVPWDFYDPCYDADLVRSVVFVLAARNGEDKSHCYTDFVTEPQSKTENWREQFDGIISLLDPNKIKLACQHFEEKQWDFLDRYFDSHNILSRRENQLRTELTESHMQAGSGPVFVKPMFDGHQTFDPNSVAQIMEELHNLSLCHTTLDLFAAEYCCEPFEEVMSQVKNKRIAENLINFRIDDPFEICFAFLYLIDKEDDAAWLHNANMAVIRKACSMLPWARGEDDDDSDIDVEFNQDQWLEGDNTDEVDFYGKWYDGADFGFEDHPRMNLAQLVYRLSYGVLPRHMHPFHEIRSQIQGDADVERAIDMAEILFLSEFKNESLINVWDAENDTEDEFLPVNTDVTTEPDQLYEEDELVLKEKNHRLQLEIKQLNKALHEMRRQSNEAEKKHDQESEIAAREHRELADLRELVFNQQEGIYEDESPNEKIEFPYQTHRRIVVFGGHDSWAREIKPKLPNVRFIDAHIMPNADLIRNADVIWIQTNRIGHSSYYKIIDEVRKYNIPVRYFTYASATKCAEQLVIEDKES